MEGIIAYFCLLWFIVQTKSVSLSEIHHALLAVVAFADGLGRGVHDCVARAVAGSASGRSSYRKVEVCVLMRFALKSEMPPLFCNRLETV